MKKLSSFFIGILLPLSLLYSQEFTCDGTFYISINQSGPPTTFYEITTLGGVNFMPLFDVNLNMNGTGLSTVDKNVYGVAFNTNEVFRVEADGTVTSVITEPDITTWNAAAGAVNNNGVYVVHDRTLDMIFLYQTGSTVTKLGSVALFWDPSTGNSGLFDHNIDDLVFDPFDDGVMYTYQRFWDNSGPAGTRGHLLKVNVDMSSPDFGMVSSVGQLDPNVIVHLGSLFFDTNGALHGYGARTSGPIVQDRLVKINQNNATIQEIGIGPQASGVDGCSCRNPLKIDKIVENIESTCDSNFITYRIEVENLSMLETVDLKLKDSLEFNGIITDINLGSFPVANSTSGGIGTDFFIFDSFVIPGIQRVSFEFTVATDLQNTSVFNQAKLYEIGVGAPILSDDPSTMEISDPTSAFLPDANVADSTLMVASLCEGESLEVNGEVYTETGTYEQSFTNQIGCDSILTIMVTVFDNTNGELSAEICEGESIEINGEVYETPGTYEQILTNSSGCDSTISIEIFVINQENGEFEASICPGESVEVNGEVFDTPGTYSQVFEGQFCDSTLIITIKGLDDTTRTETIDLCPGENIVINGEVYDETGVYTQSFTNSVGCDSTLIIEIITSDECDDCIPEHPNDLFEDIVLFKKQDGTIDLSFSINNSSFYLKGIDKNEINSFLSNFYLANAHELDQVFKEQTHHLLKKSQFSNLGLVKSKQEATKNNLRLKSILQLLETQRLNSSIRLKR